MVLGLHIELVLLLKVVAGQDKQVAEEPGLALLESLAQSLQERVLALLH